MKVTEIAAIAYIIALLFGVIGWVMNIITLISDPMSIGMTIARGIGILMFPLGAVLGYL